MTKKSELAKARYKKGSDFENEVAKYMTEVLKYDDVEVRPRVSGLYTDRGYEIDVLAKSIDVRGRKIKKVGINMYIISALFFGYLLIDLIFNLNIIPFELIVLPIILGVGSMIYVLMAKSKNMNDKYVWVECKDQKTKVKRDIVSNLLHKHRDYNLQKEKRWNIHSLMVFSASGFDHDAKLLAENENVILYEKNTEGILIKTKLNF